MSKVKAIAHPSLALLKYWGKQKDGINLPSTTSLAVTLRGIQTETFASFAMEDQVVLDGKLQDISRFAPFYKELRKQTGLKEGISFESSNNFPTAAGLASSSSGFAALAAAGNALLGYPLGTRELSELARVGSGSASRAVYGGFTLWEENSSYAQPLFDAEHWPELRVLLITAQKGPKPISSRDAMNRTRETSPYYNEWIQSSRVITAPAIEALKNRDLNALGPIIRQSYLRMFSTMFTAEPPVIFWQAESLKLLHFAEDLRQKGISLWETMDAGPQVKFFCLQSELAQIENKLKERFPHLDYFVTQPGPGTETEIL